MARFQPRKLIGSIMMVLGYILGVKVAPLIADEYVQLTVTVLGATGAIVGLWFLFTRGKKAT